MRNWNQFLLVAGILCAVGVVLLAELPHFPTQNGIPVVCNFGFKEVATSTWDIAEDSITVLGDILPNGTIGFEIRVTSGAVVFGHPNNIATGSSRVGRLVSSGQTYSWDNLAGVARIGVVSNTGTSVITIDGAWGEWEHE